MNKAALLGFYPQELQAWLLRQEQPAFRSGQLFGWLHKGASFEEMSNLPAALRETLRQTAIDQPAEILRRQVSAIDGTVKYLFSMGDGHCVEGVQMRYRYGVTLCLSTQVGCLMGCSFCASTLEGKARDLSAAEMLGMVLLVDRELAGERVHNVVLMGSGEPFDNYDEVVRFLRLVSHPEGLNVGLRHISLSTCGLVDKMLAFAEEGLPVTLSVSLHAPNDQVRQQMMPIAKRWPMDQLLDACRRYIARTGRRVVFEYALVEGVNNLPEHARELAARLRGMQCHVNLIPLNTVPERQLRGVSARGAASFLHALEALHLSCTLRREMGDDIAGACGQLRRQYLKAGAGNVLAREEEPGEGERT
ncbi:MAG: 23S rRNA (adenine(2503)-C(2))-methyltransferase RlmN [Christensenellales bacterium]